MAAGDALREWKAGWPIILTSVIGTTCVGAHVYSLGVMMKPISTAFGWSRAEISSAVLFSSLATVLIVPGVGLLIDRFGPRLVALAGVPASAAAMALVGFAGPSLWSWWAAWVLYALVQVSISPVVWAAGITRGFRFTRGLAFGVGTSGSGVAAAVYPALALWLLSHFGVRGVYPGLGLATLLILTPLAAFAFRPPAIERESAAVEPVVSVPIWGATVAQTVRTSVFWRIAIVMTIAAMATSAISIHLQPLLTDGGLSAGQAVSIAALIGPSVLGGRWLGGFLLDRMHGRWIAVASFLAPAIGCLLLVGFQGSYARGLAAAMLVGLASGVEGGLLPFLLSRYFGPRHFGGVYGLGMGMFGAGYAFAPIGAGALFDATGSYDVTLFILAGLLALSVVIAATLGRYPLEPEAAPELKPRRAPA